MLFYVRDRKSIAPRKPVDIVKEDNMKSNVTGNRDSSILNHVLKEYTNGPVENKFCGKPLTAEDQKNSPNADPSRISCMKDALVQQKNSVILAESLTPSKKPVSDSPGGLSFAKSEPECLSSLDHSGKDNNLHSNLKCLAAPDGEKNNMFSGNAVEPTFIHPQTSTGKHATDGTSQSQEVNNSIYFQYPLFTKLVLFQFY